MERKTPLYECHIAAGGKPVPFAGYLLPTQYTDIIEEHMAVREKAGLFDVSHMGEVIVSGAGALDYLNHLLTNDFTSMKPGRARYSPMCNPSGGVIDDLIVCKLGEERYFIVVNAANRDKDVAWMREQLPVGVQLEDASDDVALLALQGPASHEILTALAEAEALPTGYYTFAEHVIVAGVDCLVSRTGYTGEYGYELFCKPADAPALWNALLEAGHGKGLLPCGLGARDTLRTEASMPLYGHEMNDEISPLEAGLDFAVKMQKPDFIGKSALLERGKPKIRRVGLKVTGRGIAREHNSVLLAGRPIGHTTSGTYCPYLGGAFAMAFVEAECAAVCTPVEIEVRGRKISAEITSLPFYKSSN